MSRKYSVLEYAGVDAWLETVPFDELKAKVAELVERDDLQFEYSVGRLYDERTAVYLVSQDLAGDAGFLKPMFKTLKLRCNGTVEVNEEKSGYYLWGSVDFRYEHPSGSNGYSILDIWYNDTYGWTFKSVDRRLTVEEEKRIRG